MSAEFNDYKDPRRKAVGSQSETSTLTIDNDKVAFAGYQAYQLNNQGELTFFHPKQQTQWSIIRQVPIESGSTLIDLGCSNGCIGLKALLHFHLGQVTLADHDLECISNLQRAVDWAEEKAIMAPEQARPIIAKFGEYDVAHDYVITLSTIHWFYSATAAYGCLFRIIEDLRKITKKALIIEWVEPEDVAIGILGHIHMNKAIHKTPYTRANFEAAMAASFASYRSLGKTTATRELFVGYV